MSQKEYNDEDVELGNVFDTVKNFFKNVLKLLISVFLFYKKKIFFFLILFIIGVVAGYFIDKQFGLNTQSRQEIIIEPKHVTTKYIYNFFDNLSYNLQDEDFLKEIDLKPEILANLKKVQIEPVIQHSDVLAAYKNYTNIQDQDLHHIIEDLEFKKLEDEKYRDFFIYHKIIFNFKNSDTENTKISDKILSYIKTNQYFQKQLKLTLNQAKLELKQNKESLAFINSYLNRMVDRPSTTAENTIVFGGEKDIPTVTSLLRQKESLLAKILREERILELDKEVFSIVEKGQVITSKISIKKRLFVLLPILLIGFISLLYLVAFLWKVTLRFIEEK